jgi:hypothetical protein
MSGTVSIVGARRHKSADRRAPVVWSNHKLLMVWRPMPDDTGFAIIDHDRKPVPDTKREDDSGFSQCITHTGTSANFGNQLLAIALLSREMNCFRTKPNGGRLDDSQWNS